MARRLFVRLLTAVRILLPSGHTRQVSGLRRRRLRLSMVAVPGLQWAVVQSPGGVHLRLHQRTETAVGNASSTIIAVRDFTADSVSSVFHRHVDIPMPRRLYMKRATLSEIEDTIMGEVMMYHSNGWCHRHLSDLFESIFICQCQTCFAEAQ